MNNEQEQYTEQEYQNQTPNYSGYQPMIMPSEKADLYDKIRPEDVIETMKYLLMGYEFDKNTGEWKYKKAFHNISLSESGAKHVTNLLFAVSNKSVSISKLNDDEIRKRVKELNRTIQYNLLTDWKEYGVKSSQVFGFIKEIVISIAFITLKQPEGAGVRNLIQGTLQEHRMVSDQQKKEGMMGAIFRR